jgi:hypothetical protein
MLKDSFFGWGVMPCFAGFPIKILAVNRLLFQRTIFDGKNPQASLGDSFTGGLGTADLLKFRVGNEYL